MKSQHFDTIILGNGLTARIAAFLSGRRGRRILMLTDEQSAPLPHELPCGDHLQKLLTLLGADQTELYDASDVQLIAEHHRLTLTGQHLPDEWRRELATRSDAPARLLQTLGRLGKELAHDLTAPKHSTLFSLRGQFRIAAAGWRSRHDRILLGSSLSRLLQRHTDNEAGALLKDLFCGLSGFPADRLKVAQAALVWHGSCLPKALNSTIFSELLSRRTKQFHVTEIPLDKLASLHWAKGRLEGIELQDGMRIRAAQLAFVSQQSTKFLSIGNKIRRSMYCVTRPTWRTTPIKGGISPLLAKRFILAGEVPLRVSLHDGSEGMQCSIEAATHLGNRLHTCEDIARRLRAIVPFNQFQVEEVPLPECKRPENGYIQLGGLPCFTPRKGLITAIPEWLCPGLGVNGEIMLGIALANQLIPHSS